MKQLIQIILILTLLIAVISCDNNDDVQSSPQDGFIISNIFYGTENTYITIDQSDRNNDNRPDYYNFFFTNGRITDTYGDVGVGYAYAYSTNTSNLVKLQVFESDNPSLVSGNLTAGNTYLASTALTTVINGFGVTNSGFSKDSFASYNLQTGNSAFGTENGFDFAGLPEVIGIWHYPNNTNPSLTINAINIDTTTPANSSIDVDYSFIDTNAVSITGHYEGAIGVILD